MRAIYHPETETLEIPIEVIENLDRRLALLQVLVLIMKLLIDDMKREEQGRRWRVLWPVN